MAPIPSLYKLKEIRGRQIILQAVSGGIRVVSADGLTVGKVTRDGVTVSNSSVLYYISLDDYQQIKPHITTIS